MNTQPNLSVCQERMFQATSPIKFTFVLRLIRYLSFRAGMSCNASTTESRDSILAPSWDTSNNMCLLQSQSLLFSCRAARPGVVRLCPCRSYRKEQVALCETCLENNYSSTLSEWRFGKQTSNVTETKIHQLFVCVSIHRWAVSFLKAY